MDTNETTSPASENGSLPKKYIRTFAGDMQTFKKGDTPDLTPLEESKSSPSERLIEASPLSSAPQPVPTPAPLPPVPEQKPTASPEEEKPTPLKTYSSDFSERVHDTHASTATVLAAEQDAASWPSSPGEVQQEPPRRNYWLIAGGILLLIAGGAGGYFVYSRYAAALAPVIIASGTATPIFVDSHEQISGNDNALTQAIKQSASKPLLLNTVRALSLTGAPDGATVFSSLSVHAPDILLRNIDAAGSMAGIVNTNSGQAPFFILSVGSYRATFSGMLSWERTMLPDLGPFFPMYPVAKTTTASSSTTTPATTAAILARSGFRDEVVSNHDVRVYRDADGRSVLLYGYWDQKTLVIVRDPAAFAEILARLATSHGR
ncbi:MAG: hypothetical protein WC790_01590 [Candidatus Paceibacterota bacterium]|jgi:hypothetical protein